MNIFSLSTLRSCWQYRYIRDMNPCRLHHHPLIHPSVQTCSKSTKLYDQCTGTKLLPSMYVASSSVSTTPATKKSTQSCACCLDRCCWWCVCACVIVVVYVASTNHYLCTITIYRQTKTYSRGERLMAVTVRTCHGGARCFLSVQMDICDFWAPGRTT